MGARKIDSWIARELEKLDAVAELSIIFQRWFRPSQTLACISRMDDTSGVIDSSRAIMADADRMLCKSR